jgi:signal transduction histidine kinase
MLPSPTPRLLLGLAATMIAVAIFTAYSLYQINGLRALQSETIDRNRKDSLQLLRIQNDLHSLGLAMRDMLEGEEGYGIEAWRGEFNRIREDLEHGVEAESQLATRSVEQRQYLTNALKQFWLSVDQVFSIAESGDQQRARRMVANTLQAQQASLSAAVARLLVENNEAEQQAGAEIQAIYDRAERNVYFFVVAMAATVAAIGLAVAHANRRVFDRMAALSEQRSTLAQRLIGVQEEVFRSVSRELHDDFGQILTAIGAMLRRADKKHLPADSPLREDLNEVREIVQETLEKTRSFSQALHPTILDDYGLERALERYLPSFEKQTGIAVTLQKKGSATVPDESAIHVYRVLQEALNNVAKHSESKSAVVALDCEGDRLRLEVRDFGVGVNGNPHGGLGLIAMRERAELLHGRLSVARVKEGGTLVTLEIPLEAPE